jgi:UDP-N-acetylglucosamine acyltransferase
MGHIHPTAVIEDGATIADDATIGPLCYVGPKVTIGPGTRLVSHVSVMGRTKIGQGNTVWPQAVLGADPQDLKFHGEDAQLIIGDNNEVRECVTLHIGTENGGGVTKLGNANMIMAYVHLGHDCVVGDHCVIANAVQMAGHIHVQDHAVISGATAIHHYATVAQYAFVGGMSRIVKDVPPFMVVEGHPARVRGVNTVGLTRHRFPPEQIDRLKDAYRKLFAGNGDGGVVSMSDGVAYLEDQYPQDECIQLLVTHLRNSMIGLHGRYREAQRQDDRRAGPVK